MGTITVSVTSAQGTVSVEQTVADADLARLVAAMGEYLDSQFRATPGPDGQGDPPPAKTNANIIRAWVKDWLRSSARITRKYEERAIAVPDLPIADA